MPSPIAGSTCVSTVRSQNFPRNRNGESLVQTFRITSIASATRAPASLGSTSYISASVGMAPTPKHTFSRPCKQTGAGPIRIAFVMPKALAMKISGMTMFS
jgi:hypothetical protein